MGTKTSGGRTKRGGGFSMKKVCSVEGDTYSAEETERRANEALKAMLATPPKPHKDSKLGKRRPKP
jgi:hypothetical protein